MIDAERPVGAIAQYAPIQRVPLRKHIGRAPRERHVADQQAIAAARAQLDHAPRAQRVRIFYQQSVVDHQHDAPTLALCLQLQKQRQIVRQALHSAHADMRLIRAQIAPHAAPNQPLAPVRTQPERPVDPASREAIVNQRRHRAQLALLPLGIERADAQLPELFHCASLHGMQRLSHHRPSNRAALPSRAPAFFGTYPPAAADRPSDACADGRSALSRARSSMSRCAFPPPPSR